MRKRPTCPVCRCTPDKGVIHLETHLLIDLLNREIHPIRCAWSLRRKAQKARILGDLCASSNHPKMAIRMWAFVEEIIINKDDKWADDHEYVDIRWYTLDSLMAELEAKDLGRRIDQLYKRLYREDGDFEDYANAHYYWTKYYHKPEYYDFLKELRKELEEIREQKTSDSIFEEGQPDWHPICSRYFFTWFGEEEEEEDLDFEINEIDEDEDSPLSI